MKSQLKFIHGRTVAILLLLCQLSSSKSRHRQMTLSVAAGYQECLYIDNVRTGQTLDLEFQVTGSSAPTGKNDITVRLQSPHPRFHTLYQDFMVTQGDFNAMVEEDGDYRLCFDNTPSRWSDKIVWFEIQVEDPEDDYDDDYFDPDAWEDIKSHNEDTESLFNMGIEEIKSSVHMVRLQINKMRHYFFMNAAQMSKDTYQVENSFDRINFWSMVQLVLMIIVGVSQVATLRSLFSQKAPLNNMMAST